MKVANSHRREADIELSESRVRLNKVHHMAEEAHERDHIAYTKKILKLNQDKNGPIENNLSTNKDENRMVSEISDDHTATLASLSKVHEKARSKSSL